MACSKKSQTPVVLVAFGSTRRRNPYNSLYNGIAKRFRDRTVILSLSSRGIRSKMVSDGGDKVPPSPTQALADLAWQGYKWAAVQSLHLIAGHEFNRLVQEVLDYEGIRVSIGLPLLWSISDYHLLSKILYDEIVALNQDKAVIFIGHGTDHASWSTYLALEVIMRKYGGNVWIGVVEGTPGPEEVARAVRKKGLRRALLVPLMLVSGVHVIEDIMGPEDSWLGVLKDNGISVDVLDQGLIDLQGVTDIFFRHIQDALDVIPTQEETFCKQDGDEDALFSTPISLY